MVRDLTLSKAHQSGPPKLILFNVFVILLTKLQFTNLKVQFFLGKMILKHVGLNMPRVACWKLTALVCEKTHSLKCDLVTLKFDGSCCGCLKKAPVK